MSFVLQRSSGRGLALTQVRGNLLRIGRGTNAELRSENPAVALEHAVIEGDANGFVITDKGSITGTYVNKRPVETARLARGDVIEIGDLRLEVQVLEPAKPLFIRITSTSSAAGGAGFDDEIDAPIAGGARGGVLKAQKVDYVDAFKLKRAWLTKLSLIAILLIVAFIVVAEVTKPEKQKAFMPGDISSAHGHAKDPVTGELIKTNCRECHDPWRGVSDASCTGCHGRLPHAETQTGSPACADCHPEHRGVAKLAEAADATCVSCHGNILAHVTNPGAARPKELLRIVSFGDQHPDFTPRSDPDTLLFNHALHLKAGGVFNGEGRREELQCNQCHKLVETKGKVDPAPISFRNHCQRCHKLTFDPRFPDVEVPHGGDPGLVYGFVLATYAGNRDIIGKSPEEIRRILTSRPQEAPDERAVLNAEQVIKTKCSKCHPIERSGTRIAAKPPEIPTRWFLHATFAHTDHRTIPCESCHEKARQSTNTSDVLMPVRKDCTGCHGGQSAKTSSSCATCHEYHERSKVLLARLGPSSGKGTPHVAKELGGGSRMIETVLLWAIVLLLLVVLVPAGLALVQRIRAGELDRAAGVRGAAAAAPSAAKIPPLQGSEGPAPPPTPTPAAPAKAPDLDSTRMAAIPKPTQEAGSTVMVQWYGLIQCTSGALEGQRFIIDETGLYIGRDPAMSQVAIADNRISKRHVRIIPRDGKVMAIDQNSTNGTFIGKAGGERITEVQLNRGDVLVLADNAATFVYQI
ncbi:MAG TPA: FHA domain-containing protein [Thermoanaerobaculia bacterium]|jgi:pSer/pThr/pTyr-binding forkhead associated (FHA) protein|nr:FHA domain-containing protein [Thermoanaerobaculia bacterium]